MLGLEVQNDPEMDDFGPPPFVLNGICGNVSFTGRFTGVVYFVVTPDLAHKITGKMFRKDAEIKEHEENDVIGELTNLITGNLKSNMADAGYNCQLSIPGIMRGDDIRLSAKGFSIWVTKNFTVPEWRESFTVRVLAKVEV